MSSLLGNTTGPNIHNLANPQGETPIEGGAGGWYPDVDIVQLREVVQVIGAVTPGRLREIAVNAVMEVNNQLAGWRAEQTGAGYASLAGVPAGTVDGKSELVALYMRAVYKRVDADLVDEYVNFDTTGQGQKKAESLEPRKVIARRDAYWAVKLMIDYPVNAWLDETPQRFKPTPKITAELI